MGIWQKGVKLMQVVIDIDDNLYTRLFDNGKIDVVDILKVCTVVRKGIPLPKGHGRKFEKIVVEYPPADLCTYPEYKGKPYFSIKYEENGEHIIGFGTYNQDVFSRYLREYFVMPTIKDGEMNEQTNKTE
jgi:hypothetical protein